jgi:hypothetical protein
MKKQILFILLPLLLFTFSSYSVHKFHTALYQINFASEKKMIQITSRIHIEDINKALETKHKKKISLGDDKETPEDVKLLKDYLAKNFSIKVNGQLSPINFLSKEIEGDEIVCYSNIKAITKINSLEISNTILIDFFADQQNRINATISGEKKSFLLTSSIPSKVLKY